MTDLDFLKSVEKWQERCWAAERERDEAATALEAQAKELVALREKVKKVGDLYVSAIGARDDLRARAETAERERDAAREALKAEQSRGSYHCD
jgi:chromosome segregation ATPase